MYTLEEQAILDREKRIQEASKDLSSILSFIILVYLGNTKMGKTILAVALWISIVHYVDEQLRVTERTVKVARCVSRRIKEIWNA